MQFEIPSNHESFTLKVWIKAAKGPIKITLVGEDAEKHNTKYVSRSGKVSGTRMFEMRFPLSPKVMTINIFNPANGKFSGPNDDSSFEVVDMKIVDLQKYMIATTEKDRSFFKFAEEFSENCAVLSAGKGKPHIYRSNDNLFTIDYYNVITHNGKVLNTPSRIAHKTGVIDVAKNSFIKYTVPMRLIILLHEYNHKWGNPRNGFEISYETGADIQALYMYMGMGYSPIEVMQVYYHVFKGADNDRNRKRYDVIFDFLKEFEGGKIATKALI